MKIWKGFDAKYHAKDVYFDNVVVFVYSDDYQDAQLGDAIEFENILYKIIAFERLATFKNLICGFVCKEIQPTNN